MAKSQTRKTGSLDRVEDPGRRDFIVVGTYAMAGLGAAAVAWPLIDQMNPAADTLALANIEVDVSKISEGQSITVKWRGKPVFIRHRTADEVARANATDMADLRDPESDTDRAQSQNCWCSYWGVYASRMCRLVRSRARYVANMMGGFAHAMGRTTTHQDGYAKVQRPLILKYHPTHSCLTQLSA